ncbi:MAG TPA: malonyl-CoA decarboxylase family protein [Burkholderiales bacterium]|nr:malonyl-CoA decarboxylase family protein [Burkholderiales bacterium]
MILTSLFQRSGKAKNAAALKELRQLCHRLISEAGTANSAAIAGEVLAAYAKLSAETRVAFFQFLDTDLAPDTEQVLRAAKAYADRQDAERVLELQRVVEPPRQELLRRINRAPGGTAGIIAMRRDLLQLLHEQPRLRAVDSDFRHLLGSWFNPGFLHMQQVDWTSSAALLEKIIQHEAVHAIKDWTDLRRRLQPDRRCFAFFHPQLPGEPLIFVEVALVRSIPRSIEQLIGDSAGSEAGIAPRVAAFYSISNCEPGLRGVSLGNFLIKRVAQQLCGEMPALKRFCTLSPIPNLRAWLTQVDADALPEAWPARVRSRLKNALGTLRTRYGDDLEGVAQAVSERALPVEDQVRLAQSAAIFLARVSLTHGGDPVARFHLDNGARLERINASADVSLKGLRESLGVMVNYLYDLGAIEDNHERFVRGEVPCSRQIAAVT